jgi:uncharacterized protein (UPF0264 family)
VEQVLTITGRGATVSLAWGELADDWHDPQMGWRGRIDYAKLGLAGAGLGPDWADRWCRAAAALARLAPVVTVVYADWRLCGAPEPWKVAQLGATFGSPALLVDTMHKDHGSLVEWWDQSGAERSAHVARQHRMRLVLAGGLRLDDLQWAVQRRPDLVAMRGGLCRGGRDGTLDNRRLQRALELLDSASHAHNGVTVFPD